MASLPEELHAPPQAEPERALMDRALLLFDATTDAHGLSPDFRPGLALAALCYAAARAAGAARPELAGRDAVLAAPPTDLTPAQCGAVASAV
ncbi:MAG: hypothetical protein HGA45_24930, partial [Chloroflexales bacterium]|nr:hypothetical protein [Chloroflexales bacterium]